MKQQSLKLAIAIGLTAASLPALADVTLYDYTEATSAYEDAYLNLGANTHKNRADDKAAYNLNINTNYEKVFSAPNRDITTKLNANGNVSRAGEKGAKSENSYTAGAYGSIDTYFKENGKAFWYGDADIRANSETKNKTDSTVGLGVGYGRVVNVTPMAKAIRLMEALKYRGVIAKMPSKAGYNDIAHIISKQAVYASKYGRKDYQKYWIADIEKALNKTGVHSGNLNAVGVLEARQVLVDESISTRKHGWKVRAGVNYHLKSFSGETNEPGLKVGAEYHRPLSNRTQLSEEATINSQFNSDAADEYTFNNHVSLTHEVTDRIDWRNTWDLQYNKIDGGQDTTTNTLSSTFLYELTNSLDYNITATVTNFDGTADDGTDTSISTGLSYRLK